MKKQVLPQPNVTYNQPGVPSHTDEAIVRGMICNPAYVGIGPIPQIIDDEAWIKAAAQFIAEEGAEQFLVNMLYMLRQSIPATEVPAANNSESPLLCVHDNLPIVKIKGEYVCIGEYLFAHLYNTTVTDLISEPELTLVFQNGHTVPLLCPDCKQSLHINDEDFLLNTLNGAALVDVGWDPDAQAVFLDFGRFPDDLDAATAFIEETEPLDSLAVHLDSVHGLTCPYL